MWRGTRLQGPHSPIYWLRTTPSPRATAKPNRSGASWSTRGGMPATQSRWISCRSRHTLRDRANRWGNVKPRHSPRASSCLRARSTDSLRVIPAVEFVGTGRRFIRIEKHLAAICPCCDVVGVGTRHARVCSRAGAQANRHQPLLHAISRTLRYSRCYDPPLFFLHRFQSNRPTVRGSSLVRVSSDVFLSCSATRVAPWVFSPLCGP